MEHAHRAIDFGNAVARAWGERWRHADTTATLEERTESYASLSPALVTLFVSPTRPDDSQRAFDILVTSRTGFRVERAPDDCVAAEFAGKVQQGITGVTKLRDALVRFEQTLLQPGPDLDPLIARMRYPGTKEAAEQELQRQVDTARDQLARILH